MIEDKHLACDGWPNCDMEPDLCSYNGHQSQLIGHKDSPDGILPKTKYSETFIKRILELSEADIWEEAKLEWKLVRIDFARKEEGESCLCGKTPICELCRITNSLNGNSTQVGNVCINKFTDLPSNLIFTNIKKVFKDVDKSFNEVTTEYIYEKEWINEWEYDFLIDTERKRKLSNKQYKKRVSINSKILRKFKIERDHVYQGE
tara:strand:- start:315 stop:926 length:612 start_codon:yes stop_codon:yes gene_type:complete